MLRLDGRAFMDKDTYVRASLGLSNISTGGDDATFSFVEDHATDAMMAGTPFKDMDEFLSIAEKAWAVKCPPDTRAGWFSRLVAPCEMGEDAEQRWEEMQRYYKEEPMAKYGPAQQFFRFTPEEKAEAIEALRQKVTIPHPARALAAFKQHTDVHACSGTKHVDLKVADLPLA